MRCPDVVKPDVITCAACCAGDYQCASGIFAYTSECGPPCTYQREHSLPKDPCARETAGVKMTCERPAPGQRSCQNTRGRLSGLSCRPI